MGGVPLPMTTTVEEENDGTELAWVRRELDVLASARTLAPLSEADQARYADLARRERDLLGVDESAVR